ncbi:MAG: type II secretion system F family protein [Synechococcaceae bacterium WB9_2_170]|nr:type II secretion system F family protein [Synechococcaceae bacterium WB9_2_170]
MTQFLATVTTRSGQRRQLQIQASDGASARRQLRQRGLVATQLEPASSRPPAALDLAKLLEARPGVREKALFANKLAALVDAGVPIVRSLDLMARQQRQPLFKRALESVGAEVNQGGSLGTALRRWPQVFDPLTVAMVEAGEAGGVLDESLRRLAKLLEGNAKLQNQIKGAMGYPVAVLAIAVLVFLGMTIFLIPTFAGIFADLGAELPPFTQFMVDLSALLRSSFSLLLVAGLAIGVWLFQRHRATAEGRRQVDGLLLRLPLFGDLIQKTATAQFCRTFSSLTRAGVPILLSLEIVQDTAGNAVIADAISQSRSDVQEGIPLSLALARKKVFPEMALSMLAIGEETGGMDTMLSKVADFYEDEVGATAKALTAMLEPAMIVIVGLIVGSILLAMYLPMFSVFEKIK